MCGDDPVQVALCFVANVSKTYSVITLKCTYCIHVKFFESYVMYIVQSCMYMQALWPN